MCVRMPRNRVPERLPALAKPPYRFPAGFGRSSASTTIWMA
jgi:hypothetical protein